MALDFCIRNNHDQVIILVPVGLEVFYNIIEKSKNRADSTIIAKKLIDYYQDAEFYINELPKFKTELENLRQDFVNVEKTSEVIFLLIQLCNIAYELNKTINVRPD
jgi:hypothetical protein